MDKTVACIGGALVDRIVRLGRTELALGGVCTNLARHLKAMGLPVRVHSCVGDDARATLVRTWLEKARLPHVLHAYHGPTGEIYLAYGEAGALEATSHDTSLLDGLDALDAPRWCEALERTRAWIMDTDLPGGFLEALLSNAPPSTRLYLTTVTQDKTHRIPKNLERLGAVFMNEGELDHVTACGPDLAWGAAFYLQRGARAVYVTCGARGAWVFTHGKAYFEKSLPIAITLTSTHGAGDAFTAGVIATLLEENAPYEEALKAGMVAAKHHLERLNPCLHTA